jgi:SSS family solute:Na+ symporter
VPQLFENEFPSWFAGVGYAAIAIGALVPAAIMSIAAANLFTRNIYRAYFRPGATPQEEATVSKLVSLVVKVGALFFVLALSKSFAINLQLLGGVWILQTFPAIVVGLYTRWFHRWALLAGWAAAMVYGTWVAYDQASPAQQHFGSPLAKFPFTDTLVYIACTAFIINVLVAVVLTVILRALRVDPGVDQTSPSDYAADVGDDRVEAEVDPHRPAHA